MQNNTCPECNGSKKCPDCDGEGYKVRTINILGRTPHKAMLTGRAYEKKKEVCRTCQGSGLCPECHGTGIIGDPPKALFEDIHNKVEVYIDAEKYDEAERLLNNSLAEHGREPSLLYDLGQLISLRGHQLLAVGEDSKGQQLIEKSIGVFNEIITTDPTYKEAHLNICLNLQHVNRHKEAIEAAKRGLESFPKFYQLAVLLCMSLNKLARWEEGVRIATKKLQEIDNDDDPELDCEVLDEYGKVTGTVREEDKGAFLVCLGDASFGNGEYEEAERFYGNAIKIPQWNTKFVLEKIRKCKDRITRRST
jgi:tetratricopeptide (TPR) repeat protein